MPFSWISHFRLARKGAALSLLPRRLRPESRGVALAAIPLCMRISTRAPLHAQRGGEAPPGDRPGATTRFPRLPARRGHITNRNSTRGAFALFFFTFSMSRAGAPKKKSALFEKRFSLPVRAARTEREKRARRQRLARAKGDAALCFSFFVAHGAGPTISCIPRFFPEIPPRMKKSKC